MEKTLTARIRERWLLEPELTLQKALVMAGQIESAMAEAKAMTCGTSTSFQDVNTIPARTSVGQYRRDPIPWTHEMNLQTQNFHKLDRYAKIILVIVVDLQCTSPITPDALQNM